MNDKTPKTRIYAVSVAGRTGTRLVRAVSNVAARNHVSRELVRVSVANQNDLVHLLGNGVKVEDAATDDDQITLPLPDAVVQKLAEDTAAAIGDGR